MESPKKQTNLIACSVFDSKVGVYFQPFFARTRAEALRSFMDAVNQEGHQFNRHPGDYTLFALAEWDEDTGQFLSLPTPDNLGTALEHMSRQPAEPLQVVSDA